MLPGNEPLKTLGKYKKKRKNVARIKNVKTFFTSMERRERKKGKKAETKKDKGWRENEKWKRKIMIWICPPLMCSQPSRSKDS